MHVLADAQSAFSGMLDIVQAGLLEDAWATYDEGSCAWAGKLLNLITKWGVEAVFAEHLLGTVSEASAAGRRIADCTVGMEESVGWALCQWFWVGKTHQTPAQKRCPGTFDS